MNPIKYIIVTDKPKLFKEGIDIKVLTPKDFITMTHFKAKKQPKVINLSSRHDYLSKGYYVSLLAEARGMACIPDVTNIVALAWKKNYEFALPELNALLKKHYKEPCKDPLTRTYTSFFGRHDHPAIEIIARRIFDLFRCPISAIEIKYTDNDKWVISKIEAPSFISLVEEQIKQFHESLAKFTGSAWRGSRSNKKQERYWIAILHDPKEEYAPSNIAALKKFISVGKKMDIWVELITKQDFPTLLEFDALFIRETTAINNHTFRFASKADQEDIPCIDDTNSIIRCCNKVYLKELLETHKIPVPKTLIMERRSIDEMEYKIDFPAVLKVPDGSFSRGISKVTSLEDLKEKSAILFQKSEILLCQEFVPSAYDWRIGVLNNEPLFALKYYMAKDHWQIYNHGAKAKNAKSGAHECMALDHVPQEVIRTAINASKLIGNGLYGVDLKQLEDGRILVIEVNDNPNIDHGVEDQMAGDALYAQILQHMVKLIEA